MPTYLITSKDGKKYKVTGPSKEGALKALKKQLAEKDALPPPAKVDPATMQPAGVPEFIPKDQSGQPLAGYDPKSGTMGHSKMEQFGAFTTAAVDAIPIAGPTLTKAMNAGAAGLVTPFADTSFAENYKEMGGYGARAQEANPGYALGGRIAGTVAPMLGVGSTVMGAKVLGQGAGGLLTRTLASAGSNAAISGGDTAVRGGSLGETLKSAGVSGAIGATIPGAGELANTLGGAVKSVVAPRWNALVRPGQEAARRVNAAMARDAGNTGAPVLDAYDVAAAKANNQPLINIDRGGETTRALARSAANNDPEARGLFIKTADDRYAAQGSRTRSFINDLSNGQADDAALHDSLQAAAKKVNNPAYKQAYKDGADLVKTPELERLMGSPAVVTAMKTAITKGKDRAIKDGMGAFNPAISITDDGRILFNKTKPGGGMAFPDLQFWDYTKKELDDMAKSAARQGRDGEASTLQGLSQSLRSELDQVVPSYAKARAGAAAFFGAEDALDAGKKFVNLRRGNEATARAIAAFTPAEKHAFRIGFASELRKAIKDTNNSQNVIKQVWGSDAAKEKIQLALGPRAAHEFEQFAKVETAMDTLRGAMGNSKTAQYFIEATMAGTGAQMLTGDWKKSLPTAIITGIVRKYGGRVDDRMTKQIAQLLLSDDPTALQRATTMAANNPQAAAAVDAIQTAIGSVLRGAGTEIARPGAINQPNNAPVPAH